MAHMANISYQLSIRSSAEKVMEKYGNSNRSKMLERLVESTDIYKNKHNVESMEGWKLGPQLQYDNSKSEFTGSFAGLANQKMTRQYNGKFAIPNLAT